jgi:ketosteroid isomerase-like protein
MRRVRLSRWQRIGVLLAVVWIVIGGSWGWRHAYDKADAEFRACLTAAKTVADVKACRETRFRAIAVPRGVSAAVVALAPLAVIWLAVYGLIFAARRIRQTVSPQTPRADAEELPARVPNEEPAPAPADPGPVPTALASGPVAIGLQARPVSRSLGIEKSANKSTVEKYMDAFRRSDHQEILSCLTEDVEWVIPGAFHIKGKDAFDQEIESPAFVGRPAITVTRLTEDGNVVVAEGSVLSARKDGGQLHAVFCDVFEMRDAKIRRLISYLMEIKGP